MAAGLEQFQISRPQTVLYKFTRDFLLEKYGLVKMSPNKTIIEAKTKTESLFCKPYIFPSVF